jgi:AcrR family transcriptional regulator
MRTRRRLTRSESQAQTRERILDAAAKVFGRLGYEGASLEVVADTAGYSKGAVYSNFANKADLFHALLDRLTARRTTEAKARFEKLPIAKLISQMGDYLRGQAANEKTWDLLTFEFWLAAMRDRALRARLAVDWRAVRAALAELVASKLEAEGIDTPFTPTEIATIVQSLGTGLIQQYYLDPEHVDPELFSRALRRILSLP